MIVTLEVLDGEELPAGFARFVRGAGPSFERKYKEPVPSMELRLIQNGRQYEEVGGFWREMPSAK